MDTWIHSAPRGGSATSNDQADARQVLTRVSTCEKSGFHVWNLTTVTRVWNVVRFTEGGSQLVEVGLLSSITSPLSSTTSPLSYL
jgi:hypothetical protein